VPFSVSFVPQDPGDELAGVLLVRIREDMSLLRGSELCVEARRDGAVVVQPML
jgi:hypothetical protein